MERASRQKGGGRQQTRNTAGVARSILFSGPGYAHCTGAFGRNKHRRRRRRPHARSGPGNVESTGPTDRALCVPAAARGEREREPARMGVDAMTHNECVCKNHAPLIRDRLKRPTRVAFDEREMTWRHTRTHPDGGDRSAVPSVDISAIQCGPSAARSSYW